MTLCSLLDRAPNPQDPSTVLSSSQSLELPRCRISKPGPAGEVPAYWPRPVSRTETEPKPASLLQRFPSLLLAGASRAPPWSEWLKRLGPDWTLATHTAERRTSPTGAHTT